MAAVWSPIECHDFWWKVPFDWCILRTYWYPFHHFLLTFSWKVPGALLAPGELSIFHSRAGGRGHLRFSSAARASRASRAKPRPQVATLQKFASNSFWTLCASNRLFCSLHLYHIFYHIFFIIFVHIFLIINIFIASYMSQTL